MDRARVYDIIYALAARDGREAGAFDTVIRNGRAATGGRTELIMEINVTHEGAKATLALEGKLSVATSPDLEAAIQALPAETSEFAIDLTKLEYISSAGLRVLVSTQKLADRHGGRMALLHPNDEVMEVFDMTGLADVFVIEG